VQALFKAENAIDYQALLEIGRELFDLNDYRKAAAHTELVSHATYTSGRALILGSGEQTTPGLLTRLVQAARVG